MADKEGPGWALNKIVSIARMNCKDPRNATWRMEGAADFDANDWTDGYKITSTIYGAEGGPNLMVGSCVVYYEVEEVPNYDNGVVCHMIASDNCAGTPCNDMAPNGHNLYLITGDLWNQDD